MNSEMTSAMDYSAELRKTYMGAFPHTLFTALVWIVSGVLGYFISKPQAIILFILAGTFVFPSGELIRKMMGVPNVLSKENKLPQLFTLLAITIPLSYPLIYLIIQNNINLFFSSFSILIGAHYLPFIYGYRMRSFGILTILLVLAGTYFALLLSDQFALPAIVTGTILLVFALIHYKIINKQNYELR
jgi:hypothetical protein